MIVTADVDISLVYGQVLIGLAAFASITSSVAAIYSAHNRSKINELGNAVNGKMDRLIDTAHALGAAEATAVGATGPMGREGPPGPTPAAP